MALPDRGIHDSAIDRPPEDRPGHQEIGFTEIRSLLVRGWRTIAVCALLGGIVAGLAVFFFVPTHYLADAKLLITPLGEGYGDDSTGVGLYRILATSDSVVERATTALVAEGVLGTGAVLRVGRDLDARAPQLLPSGMAEKPAFLVLLARHTNPQTATRIVNTWAEAVVEEGRNLFRGTAAGSERLLESQLGPTNAEIEEAGAEQARLLDELATREDEITISWDRRISTVRKTFEEAIAAYNTATRQLMDEAVASLPPSADAGSDRRLKSRLQEIVSVRAQLARTPPVLSLEKAASDDTLSEVLAEGRAMSRFDRTLISEEINPLHDELALQVLRLESGIKGGHAEMAGAIDSLLAELEKIQLQRAGGLTALEESHRLELRVLQLRRGRAIEELKLEESRVRESFQRRLKQLGGLAEALSGQLNRSVVSRVLDEVEVVKLAVPASVPQLPLSRQMIIKVAVAAFLGGLLGLMITLFRSASAPARAR